MQPKRRWHFSLAVAEHRNNPPWTLCAPLAGCQSRASWHADAGQRMTAVPVAMAASMPLLVPAVK